MIAASKSPIQANGPNPSHSSTDPQQGNAEMTDTATSKYAEIIARRKAERAHDDDDQPLRFKAYRNADGGIYLVRKQ